MGNIVSYIYAHEENSITPNSMAIMPPGKFKNYACMVLPNDDDDIIDTKLTRSQKQIQQQQMYSVYYDKFNHS